MEDMGLINLEQEIKQDASEIKGIYLRDCNKFKTILISLAGPLFNLFLAFFIVFLIVFRFGKPAVVAEYKKDTAHFLQKDVIAKINGIEPYNLYHFFYLSKQNSPKLTLIRNGCSIVETELTSLEDLKLIDLEQRILSDRRGDFLESTIFSLEFVKLMSQISIQNYAKLFFAFNRRETLKISGPIGIIKAVISTAQKNEIALFLHQMALISILIGIFNLIPIPPLDGGHILFTSIKMLFGESALIQNIFNKIGLFVAIFLIGVTTLADLKTPAIQLVEFIKRKVGFMHKDCKCCEEESRQIHKSSTK
jgi:membrane-associated protease RseP (regulator of RpoE activity)